MDLIDWSVTSSDSYYRGEQAASTLEADLAKFEKKLDEMLASFGVEPEDGPSSEKKAEKAS